MLTHESRVYHAGEAVTKGTRYILIGFVKIDPNYLSAHWWKSYGSYATCLIHHPPIPYLSYRQYPYNEIIPMVESSPKHISISSDSSGISGSSDIAALEYAQDNIEMHCTYAIMLVYPLIRKPFQDMYVLISSVVPFGEGTDGVEHLRDGSSAENNTVLWASVAIVVLLCVLIVVLALICFQCVLACVYPDTMGLGDTKLEVDSIPESEYSIEKYYKDV